MTISAEEYAAAVDEITVCLRKVEVWTARLHAALTRARDRMDAELGVVRPLDGDPKPPPGP